MSPVPKRESRPQSACYEGLHAEISTGPPPLLSRPRRTSNRDRRTREYLTPAEVETLLQAAGQVDLHGACDRTLLLLAYRHTLRVFELVALRWEQIDFKAGLVHVAR